MKISLFGIKSSSKVMKKEGERAAKIIIHGMEVTEYVMERWPCIDPLKLTEDDIEYFGKSSDFAYWKFEKAKAELMTAIIESIIELPLVKTLLQLLR